VCDEVILDLLCGDHNQLTDWLAKIESLGSNPDECKTVKNGIFGQVRQRKCFRTIVRVAFEWHCYDAAPMPIHCGCNHGKQNC
jgi:hypothetical protein